MITLPSNSGEVTAVGTQCTLAGWGQMEDPMVGGDPTEILQKATVTVIDDSACKNMYSAAGFGYLYNEDVEFCAGASVTGDGSGPDACVVSFNA